MSLNFWKYNIILSIFKEGNLSFDLFEHELDCWIFVKGFTNLLIYSRIM